ncbi:MAG TPA: YtxH domain-containing protein [Muribaculum sp.]|jgi:gas vesicle protein|uniref:YtxH domain-containing protein n=1 Tax=Heminiphilus faecis TaxID=2601703 RepID=A0ABV4CVY2_9BACT|nr:YtxH domain-containing protein [Heminiphilus faecis]RLT76408.1 YtxH domain-containing protein [bacterium J10(2018)]HRF69693.1 YtxH domain-containing protein [Muribaculum sp.]
MNNSLGLISAFVGGALVGAGAALLFAPEKGADLRERICDILRKKGIICSETDVDALVERLTQDLED